MPTLHLKLWMTLVIVHLTSHWLPPVPCKPASSQIAWGIRDVNVARVIEVLNPSAPEVVSVRASSLSPRHCSP